MIIGIIQRATDAKTNTERASVIEQAKTDILGKQAENGGSLSANELEDILISDRYNTQGTLSDNNEESILDKILTSKNGKHEIKVSEIYNGPLTGDGPKLQQARGNGDLSEGDGSDENPYKIQSIEDLVTFSKNVSNGQSYDGKKFELLINLDFKNEISYLNANRKDFGDINANGTEEELIKELTTGKGFNAIGSYSKPAQGIKIEGNNNILVNLYQNSSDWAIGFFGVASDVEVNNLKFRDANISANGAIGCIIGQYSGNVKINNVHITGIISCAVDWGYDVGGLVGRGNGCESIEIKDSSNKATINCKSTSGGIMGYFSGGKVNVLNSFNTANIDVTGNSGAGIIGYVSGAQDVVIKQCYNSGNINAKSGSVGGGIAAQVYANNITIENCNNLGSVTGSFNPKGGIIAQLGANQKAIIKESHNTGEVQGEDQVGGIVGQIRGEEIKLEKCYNEAKISSIATGNVTGLGGLIGNGGNSSNTANVKILDSYNAGEVNDKNGKTWGSGGIAGSLRGNIVIENCYNTKKITGQEYTAGIIAVPQGNSTKIIGCYNEGKIEGIEANIGGIMAQSSYVSTKVEITNCYNKGIIENNTNYTAQLGGISGSIYKVDIKNCYNIGNIKGAYSSDEVYGIGGLNVENCYNIGEVTYTKETNDGYEKAVGITTMSQNSIVKGCYNIGMIKILSDNNSQAYGIAYCYSEEMTLLNNYYLKGSAEYGILCGENIKQIENQVEEIDELTTMKAKMNEHFKVIEGWAEDTKNINNGYPILVGITK